MSRGIPKSDLWTYRDGQLHCEEVPLASLATEATPLWVYSATSIERAYDAIDRAMAFAPHRIAYAVKANGNLAILRRLASRGSGADIVSGGELERAMKAGFRPESIVYSGVGKTRAELALALEAGIGAIHVESDWELDWLRELASPERPAHIALRVNPDVDPKTHPYIATGLKQTKFGMSFDRARQLLPGILDAKELRLHGVACHIGSQLSGPEPLREAVALLASFARECVSAGAPLRTIDVGGGWPMAYGHEEQPYPPPAAFGAAIEAGLRDGGVDPADFVVVTEPGRAIVGDAGGLLTRVLGVKEQGGKRFIVVDAAMTELIRPALYGAYHAVVPVDDPGEADWTPADLVGPVCESGDFIARDRLLPTVRSGDLLCVRGAGAYGREMASLYNARPRAAEILVEGTTHRRVRSRGDAESLWAGEPGD